MLTRAPQSSRGGLAALSAACFISVTSENLPVALSPQLSGDLGVSRSAVGLLVSGYAAVVALTAVPLIALTARRDRRTVAVVTIGAVAVANLVLAAAPNYPVAAAARLIAALGHGVFWSVVAPIAVRLAGRGAAGRATATVFIGNALAMVIGLPLCSALGAAFGWRLSVVMLAVVAAGAACAIRIQIEPLTSQVNHDRSQRGAGLSGVATNRTLCAVIATTLFVVLGHFTTWTYVTSLLNRYAHVHGAGVSAVLFANGLVGLAGLLLIRRGIDHSPRAITVFVAGTLAACMLTLLLPGHLTWLVVTAIVAWAVPAGGIAVALQAAVLRAAPRDQDVASAAYVVAYQVGIGAGAGLGGWFLARNLLSGAVTASVCSTTLALAVVLTARRAFPARDTPVETTPSTPSHDAQEHHHAD